MSINSITATAHPNIAFIKYWGNSDTTLRLPVNGSISMNLSNLKTTTTVSINSELNNDRLQINSKNQTGGSLTRIQDYLEKVRSLYKKEGFLEVISENNFPISAGIASSASAFAALATAISKIYALDLNEHELSTLARLGSGSACRSIPTGFVEWKKGGKHEDSYAVSIAPETHWPLFDCIMIVKSEPKEISSTKGHAWANSSPLQAARVEDTPRRLDICRKAIKDKDFELLANIIELDSNLMHAVMMTSTPSIMYWNPISLAIMHEVRKLRQQGVPAAFTLDAGANVHVICTEDSRDKVIKNFTGYTGITQIIQSSVGGSAQIIKQT